MRGTSGPSKKRQADSILNETIKEYVEIGVLRQLSEKEAASTKYWVSTFGRQKHDSTDVRMITDLRPLNATLRTPPFRADHWGNLTDLLNEEPTYTWGCVFDLKNWFFNLGLHL